MNAHVANSNFKPGYTVEEILEKIRSGYTKPKTKTYIPKPEKRFIELSDEKWLPIKNYEGYEISNYGRISSTHRGYKQLLQPTTIKMSGKKPFQKIMFKDRKSFMIHNLVAQYHLGKTCKSFVQFIDGNPLNNKADNLTWRNKNGN